MRNYNRQLQYMASPPPGNLAANSHQTTMDLSTLPPNDMERDTDDSTSLPMDSFDNTVASSDSEADLVKRGFEEQAGYTEINSIRVYPQNTTNSLNNKSNGRANVYTSNPDNEVTSTFRASSRTGRTLPGYDNTDSTPVVTHSDGPSQRASFKTEKTSAGAKGQPPRGQTSPTHTQAMSSRHSSFHNPTRSSTPGQGDNYRLDTSAYELDRIGLTDDKPVNKTQLLGPAHIQPPPPPAGPPPEEESPDDLLRRYSGRRSVEPNASSSQTHHQRTQSPPQRVLTKPKPPPTLQSRPTTDTGQPGSPLAGLALPLLRSQNPARGSSRSEDRDVSGGVRLQQQTTNMVVPYASRALVKPIPRRDRISPQEPTSQRALSPGNVSSHSGHSRDEEPPPIYSQVNKNRSQQQPRPMHQPRTQLHVQPPQQPTKWLRLNDNSSSFYENMGFYV